MQKFWLKATFFMIACAGCISALAIEVPAAEWERMKQRMAELESRSMSAPSTTTIVDTAMDSKFGPGASVTTKTGKLEIGGLLQVWYYHIQGSQFGFFHDNAVNGIPDDASVQSNSGFRVRRAELRFKFEINENFSSFIMIDNAREAEGFPHFPSNLGNVKKQNFVSPEFNAANGPAGAVNTGFIAASQNGAFKAGPPSLLQDAFINWHGCIPHHDITVGQFRARNGEEGSRDSGLLDFAERSMVGFQGENRDLGMSLHGSFWEKECGSRDGRFQYWLGVFDAAGTYFEPGKNQNRPDSNNHKDFNLAMLVRPLWDDCHGWMELGGSFEGGRHGQGHNNDAIGTPYPGLDRPIGWAERWGAWGYYRAGSFASGLWVRGEWTWIKDREVPGTVIDVLSAGTGANGQQGVGEAFSKEGITGTIGFKFGDAKFCTSRWLKPVELVARYDQFQNIETADLVRPSGTDRFYTKACTFGLNYYIVGHNAKVQANYNVINLPNEASSPSRVFHTVSNDSFVVNFQVMF